MKKKGIVCMTVMCLAVQGFSTPVIYPLDTYLRTPEHKIADFRKELKNAKKLRDCMLGVIHSTQGCASRDQIKEFKRIAGVSDAVMEAALLDIIREYSAKGWHGWDARLFSSDDDRSSHRHLVGAIDLLGYCAEAKGKKLLMDIATDNTKDGEFREIAVLAYMCCVDTREARSVIVRFLRDSVQLSTLHGPRVYHSAMCEYGRAEGDPQAREAIMAALLAALEKEKNEQSFNRADKAFAEWNKEYAESPWRKAELDAREALGRFQRGAKELRPRQAYLEAIQAYDGAENNPRKRALIAAAMTDALAALAEEKNKDLFAEADKLLAERSREYAGLPWRKAVVEKEASEQAFLTEVAKTDKDANRRWNAVRRLRDQAALAGIAKSDKDPRVAQMAVYRLTDQAILGELAKNGSTDIVVAQSAVGRLSDQAIISDIVMTCTNPAVRWKAVSVLRDQALLAELAQNDSDSLVRLEALSHLQDQTALAKIARDDGNERMRWEAARKLKAPALLAEIVGKDDCERVRQEAAQRLHWLNEQK